MKIIHIKSFGEFLVGREEGQQAYDVFKRDYVKMYPEETFFCDFTGVKIVAPSYCDEVFGRLQEEYPDKFILDQNIPHAFRVAFDTVGETRNIVFKYALYPR
jgi:hypothetical protein